jgi:hypothetical protein
MFGYGSHTVYAIVAKAGGQSFRQMRDGRVVPLATGLKKSAFFCLQYLSRAAS